MPGMPRIAIMSDVGCATTALSNGTLTPTAFRTTSSIVCAGEASTSAADMTDALTGSSLARRAVRVADTTTGVMRRAVDESRRVVSVGGGVCCAVSV